MLRLFCTRSAVLALAAAGLVLPALSGIISRGWGGGVLGDSWAQWGICSACAALLAGGIAWSRRRQEPCLPGSSHLWALLGLSLVCCLAAMLSPTNPPGHLPLSVVAMLGCMCLLWGLVRSFSLIFWWPFLSLEMMQRVGYHIYGSRINSLVLAETLEASSDEAMAYLESSNLLFFIGSMVGAAVLCWLMWLALRRQKRLPLCNTAFLCGVLACLYGATLPESPSWRQRDAYWPVMEARELGEAWAEAVFHNHATIRQVESLPSPTEQPSSLETLRGGEGVVLVVHIGESVRADRMSINGYERDTTPWLRQQKRLINFPHCISAACDTCQAQIAILTDARRDIYEKDPALVPHTGSVLDLFVKHGFKMYSFFGRRSATHLKYDRVVRILTQSAEERFHAPGSPWTSVPQMADILRKENSGQNLVLFINNEGSHTPFEHYDREQPPFMPVGGKFENPSAHAQEVNNAYDATVHYTDEFVRRVVQQLQGRPWIYLYISDHGEYLGHEGIWGRAALGESLRDYHSTTGCRVGMFLLTSPDLQQLHPHFAKAIETLRANSESGMCVGQEHIFHTLLGFFDLRTPWYNSSLDLASPLAKPYTGPQPSSALVEPAPPAPAAEGASSGESFTLADVAPFLALPTGEKAERAGDQAAVDAPWDGPEEGCFYVGLTRLLPEDNGLAMRTFSLWNSAWRLCTQDEKEKVSFGAPYLSFYMGEQLHRQYALVSGLGVVWQRNCDEVWVLPLGNYTFFWDMIRKYTDFPPECSIPSGGREYLSLPKG